MSGQTLLVRRYAYGLAAEMMPAEDMPRGVRLEMVREMLDMARGEDILMRACSDLMAAHAFAVTARRALGGEYVVSVEPDGYLVRARVRTVTEPVQTEDGLAFDRSRWMSTGQTAAVLSISRPWVWELSARGVLTPRAYGHRHLFLKRDVEALRRRRAHHLTSRDHGVYRGDYRHRPKEIRP